VELTINWAIYSGSVSAMLTKKGDVAYVGKVNGEDHWRRRWMEMHYARRSQLLKKKMSCRNLNQTEAGLQCPVLVQINTERSSGTGEDHTSGLSLLCHYRSCCFSCN
jgi:hypothetical protein